MSFCYPVINGMGTASQCFEYLLKVNLMAFPYTQTAKPLSDSSEPPAPPSTGWVI